MVKVSVVAPEMFPPLLRAEKETPALMLTSHCTVGVGFPLAAAVNDAELPAQTVLFVGLPVIAGAE